MSLRDRWTILGRSGTGKTTFAKHLLRVLHDGYPNVPIYVLDSKQTGDFTGWRTGWQTLEPPAPIASGIQVWQPPYASTASYDQWLRGMFDLRRPLVLLIDELSSLGGEDVPLGRVGRYPPHYGIMLKQGRAAGMCVITLTQEAAYIPRQVVGQATHLVRFALGNEEDGRRADKLLGVTRGEPEHRHGFHYARLDTPPVTAHYYPSFEGFFGGDRV